MSDSVSLGLGFVAALAGAVWTRSWGAPIRPDESRREASGSPLSGVLPLDVGSERKELIKINPPSRPGYLPSGIRHSLEDYCSLLWLGTGNYIQPTFSPTQKIGWISGEVRSVFCRSSLRRHFDFSQLQLIWL
jgi:hypothetical protein